MIDSNNIEVMRDNFKKVSGGGGGSSKANYSTEEKEVGTWVDGSPIYQKTYVGTLENSPYTVIDNDKSKEIISVEGYFNSTDGLGMSLGAIPGATQWMATVHTSDSAIVAYVANALYGGTYNVTLRYKK